MNSARNSGVLVLAAVLVAAALVAWRSGDLDKTPLSRPSAPSRAANPAKPTFPNATAGEIDRKSSAVVDYVSLRPTPGEAANEMVIARYAALRRCAQGEQLAQPWVMQAIAESVKSRPAASPTIDVAARKREEEALATVEGQLAKIDHAKAHCSGVRSYATFALYDAAAEAADAGSLDAMMCFVSRAFGVPVDPDERAAVVELYSRDARRFLETAFERGDWRAVALMQSQTGDRPTQHSPFRRVYPPDPDRSFALVLLRRRGMLFDEGRAWDRQIAAQSAEMGVAATLRAQAWAQDAFERYFRDSPLRDTALTLCD